MKVFIATMIAGKQTDVASIGMSARTLLIIQTDEQAARHEAETEFYRDHPPSDGWKEHQVTIFEVPPEIDLEAGEALMITAGAVTTYIPLRTPHGRVELSSIRF